MTSLGATGAGRCRVAAPETWLSLPDYAGLYEISSLGRVRSLHFDPPRPVKAISDRDGYLVVMLSKDGVRTPKRLHRLVARAFDPASENALHTEVAHLDGNRANPAADNLKWVSKVENHSHKRLHGTHQAGEKHPRAKLSAAQAADIRVRSRNGERSTALAREFGVGRAAIDDIRSGKNWRSIRIAGGAA